MKRLAIIGGSRLGQLIAHHANATGEVDVVGFFDSALPKGSELPGGPILGVPDEARRFYLEGHIDGILIGVGYTNRYWREVFANRFADMLLPSLIHPKAWVDPSVMVGRGFVALPGTIVDANVVLGDNVLMNVGSVVAHDSVVGANTFIAPAVAIAGYVQIGVNCFFGIGSRTVNDIQICAGCCIAAGAVVTKSLRTPGTYMGIPARQKP